MPEEIKPFSVDPLKERAKELETLYRVDEALTGDSLPLVLTEVCRILPKGFCNIKACSVLIFLDKESYSVKSLPEIPADEIRAEIVVDGRARGYIRAVYTEDPKKASFVSFLEEEEKLLAAVANKIATRVFHEELAAVESRRNWEAILRFLLHTDHSMLLYVCERMLALLAKNDPACIRDIFKEMNWIEHDFQGEINFSRSEDLPAIDVTYLSACVFRAASACFDNAQIFDSINLWIYQGKTYELIKLVDKKDSDVKDISKALNQYLKAVKTTDMASKATKRWLIVELVRRFLTDNTRMIESARKHLCVGDFCELLDGIICSPRSSGKVGGKATGFFLANKIIKSHIESDPAFSNIRMVKTWYIAADELEAFSHDNHLDELNEHKYRDILEIRISYPNIVHSIKSGHLSPYILSELNQILDQSEDKPLIIRSSSLLEDQRNTTFSGKYKSLFLTNTGTKTERLKSLIDGILEVYSSMFSPDSIQYRKEHGLLDYSEQMGVMIQEVVGRRIGPYFFPLYAGVGFSSNEFLWSPRIRREDGLLRMVMGLGTRAVDRVGDDFPVLISPGQPRLRVNHIPQEMQKYSPQMIDVLDTENNMFVTISIRDLIRDYGVGIPCLNHVASFLKYDLVTEYNKFIADPDCDNVIVTFDGLINKTPVVSQLKTIMSLLEEKLGFPVDVEFASDGQYVYILQCRPQSGGRESLPAAIPAEIPAQSTIFTASKYISNGKVTGIKTVVYVDPEEYGRLEDHQDLARVGNAVSELNRILYRKSFILMGPGRWGSRGDIKLGVRVTYSDINNTSMLIEIAKKKSKHLPELSFGTHFFQDLVEANIKYLPLYPEDDGIIFQSGFFHKNTNSLEALLPAYADLSHVIKVISIPENYFKKELVVLMNAELGKAVAYLEQSQKPDKKQWIPYRDEDEPATAAQDSDGWKWRHYMAEKISSLIDMEAFGVKGIYLFGSTSTCTARLNSDIDLLIHVDGTDLQKQELNTWLEGWSQALSEMNYLKTGYQSEGLLDIHFVLDRDIENKDSYASKINSVYDPAVVLRLREDK
ncbi:MAG TPA: PEP/pyruvate-binding domain-containing protein [Anaerovoracaceae bacterium]|nr:PEP/pyruvate-binding domain-containing protein [Anaerovoracaceae bacterium]